LVVNRVRGISMSSPSMFDASPVKSNTGTSPASTCCCSPDLFRGLVASWFRLGSSLDSAR
jgi:hypothetical protein